MKEEESTATSVLKLGCSHVEPAFWNTSTSEHVTLKISPQLTLTVCQSCAASMQEQGLPNLGNT